MDNIVREVKKRRSSKIVCRIRIEEPDLTQCPVWGESCQLRQGLRCWHWNNKSDQCSKEECPIGKEE